MVPLALPMGASGKLAKVNRKISRPFLFVPEANAYWHLSGQGKGSRALDRLASKD